MKSLTALWKLANILFGSFVFSDVTLTVVFPYELTAAVVARVRSEGLVRVHVGYVLSSTYECSFAQGTFEGFRRARYVSPAVDLEVPFCCEKFVTYDAGVGALAAVCYKVRAQVRPQVDL